MKNRIIAERAMKKIFNILVIILLFSTNLPAKTPDMVKPGPQDLPPSTPIMETLPVGAEVHPDKSVLRPGETVKITLMNFEYPNKIPPNAKKISNTVIVKSSAGLVMGGTPVVLNEDFFGPEPAGTGSVKAFLLGNGENTIEVYYRAPLRGKQREVNLEVFAPPQYHVDATLFPSESSTVSWETNSEGKPMIDRGERIADETLKIKWGIYFLLNYEERKTSKRGSREEYKHEINSVIRIDCEPWISGSMLQVTDLQVLEFNGKADLIGADSHKVQEAVSAEPFAYNALVLLNLDPESQAVVGIIYESVPLNVDWQGDEIPEGPPDVVEVGPVSKYEKDSWGAAWAGALVSDQFPGNKKDPLQTWRKQREVLHNFAATQVHPDHLVTKGDGTTFFAGQGRWEKSSVSNSQRKTYTWELYITDK